MRTSKCFSRWSSRERSPSSQHLSTSCSLAAGLLLALSSGCASLVSDGNVGDREVRLDGTGFAWLDETVYVFSSEGAELKGRDSGDVTLHVVFTSAVFDPTVDLRSLSVSERARIEDEIGRGDLLRLQIRRGHQIIPGDTLDYSTTEPAVPGAGPYLSSAQLVLGSPPLEPDATYPDEITAAARELDVDVTIEGIDPRLLGVVDVAVRRGENDQGAEGDITVRFDIERVSERVAECNFAPSGAGGGVDPCRDLSLANE